MPQPLGIGEVVGGRYRITRHVVTSADQDIVFQATDQVLGREVSVLLASRANAKQVATSAKELATGERHSEVEVLDLGLAEDRTFLISTLVDPNNLLDLVVPDTAPYVEPYFTDSLGSELFGRSREMQPQTYEDDDEYYARLHTGRVAGEQRRRDRRPAFLDKVVPSSKASAPAPTHHTQAELESALESAGDAHGLNISQEISRVELSLRSDLEEVEADPAADAAEDSISAVRDSTLPSAAEGPQAAGEQPGTGSSSSAPGLAGSRSSAPDVEDLIAEGEEVVDSPPEAPLEEYDRRNLVRATHQDTDQRAAESPFASTGATQRPGADREPASFTSLIRAVGTNSPAPFPSAAQEGSGKGGQSSPSLSRWLAAGVLGILVLVAAIIMFMVLSG